MMPSPEIVSMAALLELPATYAQDVPEVRISS